MPIAAPAVVPASVLLVRNDHPTWLQAVSATLRAAGFEVRSVTSGGDALHHVNKGFHPAVVVATAQMAGIGGLELASAFVM